MIALEVELLTGRYVATSHNDRSAPEWPPHPARVYSALVDLAMDKPVRSEALEALRWLEAQGPPRVLASEAQTRSVVSVYVPENTTRVLDSWERQEQQWLTAQAQAEESERSGDAKAVRRDARALEKARSRFEARVSAVAADPGNDNKSAREAAMQMLPEHRRKQPRTLPSVTPIVPRVLYVWPEAEPTDGVRRALTALACRLVRVGHSSSFVACRVRDGDEVDRRVEEMQTWVPDEDGGVVLRTVGPGQLERLGAAFDRHQGIEPRVLPAVHQGYRRGDQVARAPARSVFGEWLVLREVSRDGPRLGLLATKTEDVTRAVRGAVLHHADDPPPAVLSGHTADRRPLEEPHVAFLALSDVQGPHASGKVLGVAVVMPVDIDAGDRQAVLRAVGRWEGAGLRLTLGRAGVMHLERVVDEETRTTLRPETWAATGRRWATATPIALDENPGDLQSRDPATAAAAAERAEAIVAHACERIGLPAPEWVQVMRRSVCAGAPAAQAFMPYPRHGRGLRRVCVHAELRFGEEVAGPVLLGAGRYFGLGLCRPVWEG